MIQSVEISTVALKQLKKLPIQVRDKLLEWVDKVRTDGLEQVRKQPGYHDELLKGIRVKQRSIRLNKQWRAIYMLVEDGVICVSVLEVIPHKY